MTAKPVGDYEGKWDKHQQVADDVDEYADCQERSSDEKRSPIRRNGRPQTCWAYMDCSPSTLWTCGIGLRHSGGPDA